MNQQENCEDNKQTELMTDLELSIEQADEIKAGTLDTPNVSEIVVTKIMDSTSPTHTGSGGGGAGKVSMHDISFSTSVYK